MIIYFAQKGIMEKKPNKENLNENYIDLSNVYLAKVAIRTKVELENFETSDTKDIFFVEPIMNKVPFDMPFIKKKIIGYREIITKQQLIKREYYYLDEYSSIPCVIDRDIDDYVDRDSEFSCDHIGDLVWDILEQYSVEQLCSKDDILSYLNATPAEMYARIASIRKQAKSLALEIYKTKHKIKH